MAPSPCVLAQPQGQGARSLASPSTRLWSYFPVLGHVVELLKLWKSPGVSQGAKRSRAPAPFPAVPGSEVVARPWEAFWKRLEGT